MDLEELSTRALLVRILRELEESEIRDKHIENELAHIAHVVRKIERDVRPLRIGKSTAPRFVMTPQAIEEHIFQKWEGLFARLAK